MTKIQVPEIDVHLDGKDEPFRVQITNGVVVRYELEARKRGWGEFSESGTIWAAYAGYLGALRLGEIAPAVTWDQYLDMLIAVNFVDSPEEEEPEGKAPVRRTRKKAESGSS